MRFDVITLFPDEVMAALRFGVIGRALTREQVHVVCTNPRDFTTDAYRRVDERVYGGGPGMVMLLEPLKAALAHVRAADPRDAPLTLLSPQGVRFDQGQAQQLALQPRVILLCGRYEGIDQRFIDNFVAQELSIGDYVLSGGELGALVVIDAVTRLLPGVLNKSESAEQDSFTDGLLDCPHYTRPEKSPEGDVPEILKSGNHAEIARWRRQQSLGVTWLKRPDLLARRTLSAADTKLLSAFQAQWQARQMGSNGG
jgi:tRNA (guanine37-N1)-methyltransferase